MNLVLTRGASKLQECKAFLVCFFTILNGLAAFFNRATTRTHHCLMTPAGAVFLKRLQRSGNIHRDWSIQSLKTELTQSDCLINSIFNYSDVLLGILQGQTSDVHFCLTRVKELCTRMSERGAGSVRSPRPKNSSPIPAHTEEAQTELTLAHATKSSTAISRATLCPGCQAGFKSTENECSSPSWSPELSGLPE